MGTSTTLKASGLALAVLLLSAASLSAQDRSPVCSIQVAYQATASGMDVTAGSTVYSGEVLRVSEGGQLFAQCKLVRLGLIDRGAMRVFQSNATSVVELERGDLIYSSTGPAQNFVLYSLDVRIAPDMGKPFEGRVDAVSDCQLSIQSEKGPITVTSGKETRSVKESKAYEVTPVLGVNYADSWQPVLPDYPEFAREAPYHRSHTHTACPAAAIRDPAWPLQFREIAPLAVFAGSAVAAGIVLFESPDKP